MLIAQNSTSGTSKFLPCLTRVTKEPLTPPSHSSFLKQHISPIFQPRKNVIEMDVTTSLSFIAVPAFNKDLYKSHP